MRDPFLRTLLTFTLLILGGIVSSWVFLDGSAANEVVINLHDMTGRKNETAVGIVDLLSSHPAATKFSVVWENGAFASSGQVRDVYDRQKGTLTEDQHGTDGDTGTSDEQHFVFSGVTDDIMRQLAKDKKYFDDLPQCGCKRIIATRKQTRL